MKRLLNFLAVALLLTVAASCKKDDPTPQKTVAGTPKTIEGIETVYIPAGTFLMGSPESEPLRQSYENQHSVTLAKGFWMSAYEITNAQFCAFLNANNSSFDVVPHNFPRIRGSNLF